MTFSNVKLRPMLQRKTSAAPYSISSRRLGTLEATSNNMPEPTSARKNPQFGNAKPDPGAARNVSTTQTAFDAMQDLTPVPRSSRSFSPARHPLAQRSGVRESWGTPDSQL